MSADLFHEEECIEFRAEIARPVRELRSLFKRLGFTFHDDVVSLDREGSIPPWQHTSIVEVEIQREGKELVGLNEGTWDTVQLKYLFATLPFELTDLFIATVEQVSAELRIAPRFNGIQTTISDLKQRFKQINSELLENTGETAGSESLAILIQSSYPRR